MNNEKNTKPLLDDEQEKLGNQEDSIGDNKEENAEQQKRTMTLKLVRARFLGNPKTHTYRVNHTSYKHGDKIVAPTDRGVDVGHITSFVYEKTFTIPFDPIDKIIRKATAEDLEKYAELQIKKKEGRQKVASLIEKHDLNMNLSHVEFTQWGKKLVIYYTSSERVDFRELLKDLTTHFKLQIELRQISQIDRMIAVGGITVFGEEYSEYSLKKHE